MTLAEDRRHDRHDRPTGSQPHLHQRGPEVQRFGTLRLLPIALPRDVRVGSVRRLNQVLADSQVLHGLYKKHHWLMRGATFYQLHLLLDRHVDEQLALVDAIAERVQMLGGVAIGDVRLTAELTTIPRPPDGAEGVPEMLSRLLDAHERIIRNVRGAIGWTAGTGDAGTNDLLTSSVLVTHERQVWFLAEHLVDIPLVDDEPVDL